MLKWPTLTCPFNRNLEECKFWGLSYSILVIIHFISDHYFLIQNEIPVSKEKKWKHDRNLSQIWHEQMLIVYLMGKWSQTAEWNIDKKVDVWIYIQWVSVHVYFICYKTGCLLIWWLFIGSLLSLIHLSGDMGGAQVCFHARIFNG